MKKGRIVVLTGTPGTGKDTIAKHLARQGFVWIPLNSIVEQQKLWSRKERGAKVVSLRKLTMTVDTIARDAKRSGKSILIEGHLACEIPIRCDLCIVLRTDPKILGRRLGARGYPKRKVEENVECELIDYCTQLAEQNLKCPIYEIDTGGSLRTTLKAVKAVLEGKGKRYAVGRISWVQPESGKSLISL